MQANTNDIILLSDELLNALPGDNPAGTYLLYDPVYDRIKEALREDDPDISRGVWEIDLKKADWNEAARLCAGALRDRTRDIQVAGWLMQASTRLRGFDGFKEGLQLLLEYCERFWEWLHPVDLEYRAATFEWIDRRVPEALRAVPLVRPAHDDMVFSFHELEQMRARETDRDVEPDENALTSPVVDRLVEATATDNFQVATQNLEEALQATRRLQALLDDKMGHEAPALRQLAKTGESIHEFNHAIWRQREPEPVEVAEATETALEENATGHAGAELGTAAGPIKNRHDAYRRLLEAAEFLQKSEPHSPTPYLVRRAVSWGDMSLEELLTELVGDSGNLLDLYRLLGMKGTEGSAA